MFEVLVAEPNPGSSVRGRATAALCDVLVAHAQLRANDLAVRREFLSTYTRRRRDPLGLAWQCEIEMLEQRIVDLAQVRSAAAARAATELPRLLRLVGSLVEGLEMGQGCLAARIRTRGRTLEHARMALVPKPERASRVRRQIYAEAPPPGLEPSTVPCLGVAGNGYVDDALDRLDLVSLVLTFVSHVRANT